MRLLLDTHVALWWLLDDPALPEDLADVLDHEPDIYLSVATIWEVAIKQAAGKLEGPTDLPELLRDSGFVLLAIETTHAIAAGQLPLIHRDPFDRMLVAQARSEGLRLVTRDPWCHKYDVEILPV
ncbi:type II toxin-antitoxin system VapC family toxin [Nocardia donostiensis]|uniref:Twitching motility protein PilT n=1 Tax=Nocardia donostiensis TaxID=1538463 RepID=A0A1V2TDB9_9NOCA|nr:type II toxin-antitoxin system VapC family toxin [Nocardia donostiensis]ONM47458.1 twitching motility protein PilT [Nocardia donostiensis]OQS14312.1 twitching motility protein PilT [Nocardia donostiensis]OQS17859.1 twitching motility protein PilT [Nocardia donostiensis]